MYKHLRNPPYGRSTSLIDDNVYCAVKGAELGDLRQMKTTIPIVRRRRRIEVNNMDLLEIRQPTSLSQPK